MLSTVSRLLIVAGLIISTGCRATTGENGFPQDIKPALLVGPEATSQAPPPIELPAKQTAQLCLRTAHEYEKNGQTTEAIRLYEKARSLDRKASGEASRRLAVLYDKVGEFTKSTNEYESLMVAHPKDANLLNDYGYSCYSRGDWTGAETALLRAVELDPKHKRAWVNLGMAQSQQDKWDESYKSFCQAIKPAGAHCNIAFALAAQGKKDEARAQYQQALTLDPSMRVAQSGLARLDMPDPVPGEENKPKGRPEKFDAAAAAAKVPSIAQLEARMAMEALGAPTVLPATQLNAPAP